LRQKEKKEIEMDKYFHFKMTKKLSYGTNVTKINMYTKDNSHFQEKKNQNLTRVTLKKKGMDS